MAATNRTGFAVFQLHSEEMRLVGKPALFNEFVFRQRFAVYRFFLVPHGLLGFHFRLHGQQFPGNAQSILGHPEFFRLAVKAVGLFFQFTDLPGSGCFLLFYIGQLLFDCLKTLFGILECAAQNSNFFLFRRQLPHLRQ